MQRLSCAVPARAVLAVALVLLCAAPATAFDCELENITRNGKHVGTTVINDLDNYCGTVHFRGGGYSVNLENEPKKFYSSDYSYRDVLQYMCDACKFRKTEILSDQ